jgi:hypothetical protein
MFLFSDSHTVRDVTVAAGYSVFADYNGEASVRRLRNEGCTILNFYIRTQWEAPWSTNVRGL